MSSLIACPGCKNKLMLPTEVIGQRVQCPRCALEFEAQSMPSLELEPAGEAPPVQDIPQAQPAPPLETAYASGTNVPMPLRDKDASFANPSIYCSECGVKFARTREACPACGYPSAEHVPPRAGRLPRGQSPEPVHEFLALAAVILIPLGVGILFAAAASADGFRRHVSPDRLLMTAWILATLVELAAIACAMTWLYQAWRAVLRDDEEYSPGLMVGLLWVPVFNLYWMFRAVPGLSAAVRDQLHELAPHQRHGTGWGPGLTACILMLIPYLQPVAICFFLAWLLLTDNAIRRLARYHRRLRDEAERIAQESRP